MSLKISSFFSFLLILSFLSTTVSSVGLAPPQLRMENVSIGEETQEATLVVSNTGGSGPSYIIFKISCLEKTREQKLRVICLNCSRDVGIQRGDLVDGCCPFCGASGDKLIFYDLPPSDVMSSVMISCDEYPLEPYMGGFRTKEKISPGAAIDADISVNIPDKAEYYGKHWELRIMATTVTDLNATSGMSMNYGAETKFLVDTVAKPAAIATQGNSFIIMGSLFVVVVIGLGLFYFFKIKKSSPRKNIVKNTGQRGRKIL